MERAKGCVPFLASLDSERAGHRPGESGAQPAQAGRCGLGQDGAALQRAVPPCGSGQAQSHGRHLFLPSVGDALGIRGSAGGSASPSRGRGTFATLLAYPRDPGTTREREGNILGRERERNGNAEWKAVRKDHPLPAGGSEALTLPEGDGAQCARWSDRRCGTLQRPGAVTGPARPADGSPATVPAGCSAVVESEGDDDEREWRGREEEKQRRDPP